MARQGAEIGDECRQGMVCIVGLMLSNSHATYSRRLPRLRYVHMGKCGLIKTIKPIGTHEERNVGVLLDK